ncbi:hypothetical protein QUB70_31050 [Microcoleus sp. A003_D6]
MVVEEAIVKHGKDRKDQNPNVEAIALPTPPSPLPMLKSAQ